MIAKIGHGEHIMGALSYNHNKVEQEKGEVLDTHRIRESPDGSYTLRQLYGSFEPYLVANKQTEKPALHISLNPDPKDNVSDEAFRQIARDYMQRMGYGDQPYIVYKHSDIERTHIHIVSVCVDSNGKKIPDTFEKLRSMDACREIERQYNLIPATEKQRSEKEGLFRPVDYKAGDIKSQVASVVRHLPKYYQYQSMGAYNALLSLFHITAEEVKGELHGQSRKGLVYFALDEKGQKAGNPLKASRFGKDAGLEALQQHIARSKQQMKGHPARAALRSAVEAAMHTSSTEMEFKTQLLEQGINTVIRRNDAGRIYGITFIDHGTRTVWNGSQLDKNLSANIFNDWWQQQPVQDRQEAALDKTVPASLSESDKDKSIDTIENPHELFGFLGKPEPVTPDQHFDFIEGMGGLLPEVQGTDYEELAFENQMKKKQKRKRGYRR